MWFGADAEPVPLPDFRSVLGEVRSGAVDFAILPVANTLAGAVTAAFDAFLQVEVDVIGEIVHSIRHQLLALPGVSLDQLRSVCSHPVALDQCRTYLASQPRIEVITGTDTAGAARRVRDDGDPGRGAIASAEAGRRYGLSVVAADVQDRPDNQTRFWVLRGWATPKPAPRPGPCRSLFVFEAPNEPGALVRVLRVLADGGINLTALTVRPGDEPWRYRFIAEVEADLSTGAGADAISAARPHVVASRMVGPYPVVQDAAADAPTRAAEADAEACRRSIDAVDVALVRLLAQRRDLARRIQSQRVGEGGVVRDPRREAEVLRRAAAEARTLGLPEESVRQLFWKVVESCHP